MPRILIDPVVRFFRKTEPFGDCLLWTGSTGGSNSTAGYFRPGTKQTDPKVRAHRWIYEQLVGPIPEGYDLDHVRARGCVGSLCVNVLHLEPVTHVENMRRARLETCRSGKHSLLLEENQHWDKLGRRRGCAACRREFESRRVRKG